MSMLRYFGIYLLVEVIGICGIGILTSNPAMRILGRGILPPVKLLKNQYLSVSQIGISIVLSKNRHDRKLKKQFSSLLLLNEEHNYQAQLLYLHAKPNQYYSPLPL